MMNRMYLSGVALAALLAIGPGAALAEDWTLGGHLVTLDQVPDEGFRLSVDGKVVLEDWLILDPETLVVPGGIAFYFVAGAGGNACDAAPFVLYLPEGGKARLDGPIETCSYLESEVTEAGLRWTSPNIPGRKTGTWDWTPAAGIIEGTLVEFAPDAGTSWDMLPTLTDGHPVDAIRLEPVYTALRAGLGAQWDAFATPIGGIGSAEMVGPDYYGEACTKEVCDEEFAGLWLDAAPQKVFAYWKSYDSPEVHLFPADRSEWPKGAQEKLAERGL